MGEFQDLPENYEAETEDFVALYAVAWLLIIRALMKLVQLPPNPTPVQLLQLEQTVLAEVRVIIADLSNKVVEMATEKVTEAYKEGVKYSRESLTGDKQPDDIDEIELNKDHVSRLDKMITQTQEDLLKATGNTEENIKRLVRQVVSREISGTGLSGQAGKVSNMSKRIEEQLRKQFIENGIKNADIAIIDKAKRKWKLKTYSEMVARTKMNMAYIEAVREEALQDGSDLAIISTKPDTKDACLNYEGMVISLNGKSEGYLTYDQIRSTKLCFHPNCGHFVRPVGGIDWVPRKQIEKHEKQMKKYNQAKDTLKQQTNRDSVS